MFNHPTLRRYPLLSDLTPAPINSARLHSPRLAAKCRLLVITSMCALLLLLNVWRPCLRFDSQRANYAFAVLVFCLPIPPAIMAFQVWPRWIGIVGATACALSCPITALGILGASLGLLSTTSGGQDYTFHPISEARQGPIRIRAYDTGGPGDGISVREERRILPHLLLVRDIFTDGDAAACTVSSLRRGYVRIRVDEADFEAPQTLDLRLPSLLWP